MSSTKQKSKKINVNSTDSGDESEHELFYYANDRIRLMKEVLKLIKPKKIKAIAPDFMKNLDIDEINSILLEELLGISNKRLRHILNGDNIDTVSTSSESEQEQPPIDVISLDDISDTDDDFGLGSVNTSNGNVKKDTSDKTKSHKEKKRTKEIKKEKGHNSTKKIGAENESDKLMNVLEILELQARARAIRSQLALESIHKKSGTVEMSQTIEDDDDTAVILSSPKNEEIVITSSDSEREGSWKKEKRLHGNSKEKDLISRSESKSDEQNSGDKQENESCSIGKNNLAKDNVQNDKNKLLEKESAVKKLSENVLDEKMIDTTSSKDPNKENSNNDKNDAVYRSDSDNDVINLDSEDIENV
ncbi:hypothetical protein AMK59_645 [Oryctes borbonicus]|uniref:Uncharacterized protein n=1 Tax=Oryctes borbonicus TaxID=1629725 RepID=A0A0T6BD74_9SCAR|nr:hypothetical protein AMK59_645 [Oryctes borbonicus]